MIRICRAARAADSDIGLADISDVQRGAGNLPHVMDRDIGSGLRESGHRRQELLPAQRRDRPGTLARFRCHRDRPAQGEHIDPAGGHNVYPFAETAHRRDSRAQSSARTVTLGQAMAMIPAATARMPHSPHPCRKIGPRGEDGHVRFGSLRFR
jgi:hypothetical protein